MSRDVNSLKELLEGNEKGMHESSGQNYGNRKETGNLAVKKNCRRQTAIFFFRFAIESEKAFSRIFDFLRCSGLPKSSVLRWTIQNFMTLTSPSIMILIIFLFSHKKVSLVVIVNNKVHKRVYFIRDHIHIYLYNIYIYVWMYVCMYMYMYTCRSISCIYSLSCIHIYMGISFQSRSGHHLTRCQHELHKCMIYANVRWLALH